jgi:hypothetical protein
LHERHLPIREVPLCVFRGTGSRHLHLQHIYNPPAVAAHPDAEPDAMTEAFRFLTRKFLVRKEEIGQNAYLLMDRAYLPIAPQAYLKGGVSC